VYGNRLRLHFILFVAAGVWDSTVISFCEIATQEYRITLSISLCDITTLGVWDSTVISLCEITTQEYGIAL